MFSNASGFEIHGGTFTVNNNNSPTNRTSRGMDLLLEWVAAGACHNSDELYDAPKCHPHTRVAVLEEIMNWVGESESARDEFMMWLFGPAGAGKSAIAKRIAEIAADMGILIATFFFSRTSPTRSSKDRFIATLAYQLAQSIPDTRAYIENAIEQDPTIFRKNLQTQIDTLLIKALQSISQITPSKKLIIIDGLDECNNSKAQVSILETISHSFTQFKSPIIFLVASRAEPDLVSSFNCNEPLKFMHRRLALDATYRPNDDIRLFFSDKFEHIKHTHPLRSTIPPSWPAQEMLETLVNKSSGQFIYASTVVKFVESSCHRPTARLNIILGVSPPGKMNPFAELDALYNHLLSTVDDIQITLRVLSLYVMTPRFSSVFRHSSMSPELFLSLEPGDIQLALLNLSSVVTYRESSGEVEILHASLVDFLSDEQRSTIYYIDMASICTDFVHRILQYVKGPDGALAGDIPLFEAMIMLSPWIPRPKGRLRNEILDFDLYAFINASIRSQYREHHLPFPGFIPRIFAIWRNFISDAGLADDGDTKELLDRPYKSLELCLVQTYQTDWRLQLLLTLAVSTGYYGHYLIPICRCMDILLEMDDHHLHLVDQHALDLRHTGMGPLPVLTGTISRYINGDTFATAALHCMRFLSHPPRYSDTNECPEMGLIYAEWEATCNMTLELLCIVLAQANTSPELVQFISHHDIHPAVQNHFSSVVSKVNAHILAFLNRATVCVNWRMKSATQESHVINDKPPSWTATRNFTQQRIDQCCQGINHGLIR